MAETEEPITRRGAKMAETEELITRRGAKMAETEELSDSSDSDPDLN